MEQATNRGQDISILRMNLEKKYQEKESWFQKKEALRKEVLQSITEIKTIKKALDQAKTIQNQLKAQRDIHNQQTKALIVQIKPLQEEKKTQKKQNPWISIHRIQQTIERLDTKIETEVMEFEKEKQLMTKIKKLKKQLDEQLIALEGRQQYYQLSKEIREVKKKADDFHNQLHEAREKERQQFEEFIALTKKITGLKRQQEDAYQHFLALKQEYSTLAKDVKGKFQEKRRISAQRKEERLRAEKQRQQRTQRLLEEKSKDIEEKLKSKKKLTTEDLIAFQGLNKNQ